MEKFRKDELLQLIINSFPGLLAYIDKDERYQLINSTYENWLDRPVLGCLVKDVFKGDYAIREPHIKRALSGEKSVLYLSMKHKDRGLIPVEYMYIPHFDSYGIVSGVVIVGTDLSEHRKAEEIANKERASLYSLFMHAPVAIAVLAGPRHKVDLINSAAKSMIQNKDISGMFLGDALPELRVNGIVDKLNVAFKTGNQFTINEWKTELINDNNRKSIHYFDLIFVPWRNTQNLVSGVLFMGTDVTGLVLERKQLEVSERNFRMYAESMPQMAFVANGAGVITYYNKRWFEYTGFTEKESFGPDGRQVEHSDDFQRTRETWANSIQTGQTYQMEYRLRRHDGVYRWHLGRAVPLKNGDGKIINWIGTNTDIHDQKETEAQLERTVKGRDEFLSIASHELKTPLTSLKLQSQMIARALEKGDLDKNKLIKNARQTNDLVNKLSRLIDDMLDVSRINTGRISLDRKNVELVSLVKEAVSRLEETFRVSNNKIPIVEAEEEITGHWDRLRIEQVINNLLTNAIRYGRGKPIYLKIWRKNGRAFFSVTDQGVGIAKKDRERIFERYERAIGASEVSGMGLGLYITRQLVTAHGGSISVESTLNIGSTFTVELPLS